MIKNYKNAETIYEADGVVGKKLNEENGCEYVQLSIAVNKEIAPHVLPIPVTFYVLQGKAELSVDEKITKVEKDDLIEIKQGSARGWKNIGKEKVLLLATKHLAN